MEEWTQGVKCALDNGHLQAWIFMPMDFYDDNDDITLTVYVQFSTLISIPYMSMCITLIQIVRRINLNALKMAVAYPTH